MILSVIVPVYNEEKTVIEVLEKIKKNSSDRVKYEIVVIDDGSTDQTRKLLESKKHLFDKLLINETNKGKGFSVNVPLAPHTDDEIFHWAFDAVVPPIVDAFVPDVLVTQLGMDTHFDDPITHLEMTVQGHGEAVRKLGQMTKKWVGKNIVETLR